KNQKPIEEIHLIAIVVVIPVATIRKEIKLESVPVVAIGLKGQKNPRNTKEEIGNDKKIKYQDLLNLSIEESLKNINLDHLVDGNVCNIKIATCITCKYFKFSTDLYNFVCISLFK
ncbi:hypothetical protein ALC62_06547, partial [Cyphomyrmex costatus]